MDSPEVNVISFSCSDLFRAIFVGIILIQSYSGFIIERQRNLTTKNTNQEQSLQQSLHADWRLFKDLFPLKNSHHLHWNNFSMVMTFHIVISVPIETLSQTHKFCFIDYWWLFIWFMVCNNARFGFVFCSLCWSQCGMLLETEELQQDTDHIVIIVTTLVLAPAPRGNLRSSSDTSGAPAPVWAGNWYDNYRQQWLSIRQAIAWKFILCIRFLWYQSIISNSFSFTAFYLKFWANNKSPAMRTVVSIITVGESGNLENLEEERQCCWYIWRTSCIKNSSWRKKQRNILQV